MSEVYSTAPVLENPTALSAKTTVTDLFKEARDARAFHKDSQDLDQFAVWYFDKYENYPPDIFAPSSSYIWREVAKATAPNGYITKLHMAHKELFFVTLLPKHLWLNQTQQDPALFFNRVHLEYLRSRLKGRRMGLLYYRIELSPSGVIHIHLIVGRKALGWPGHVVGIYDLEGLIRYLKKPLMAWTAENFARYLRAKRAYGRLSPHSGMLKS